MTNIANTFINHVFFFFWIFTGGWHNSKHGAKYCSASASIGPIALATNKWTSHVNCCIRKCRVSTPKIIYNFLALLKGENGENLKSASKEQREKNSSGEKKKKTFSVRAQYQLGFVRLFFFLFPCTSNTESDLPQSIIKWKVCIYTCIQEKQVKHWKYFFPFSFSLHLCCECCLWFTSIIAQLNREMRNIFLDLFCLNYHQEMKYY